MSHRVYACLSITKGYDKVTSAEMHLNRVMSKKGLAEKHKPLLGTFVEELKMAFFGMG